ncbi:hypothetical protein VP01_952g4 [Puccinia sorghi]|uniref:Uncharacterized protein n=1 Tax=Puccinia sorghi TaxID=27349 RepID=A0A0L6U6V9_9BASI|nr:hypothetical protein VP01_952g4 [Puccinia sorghi]
MQKYNFRWRSYHCIKKVIHCHLEYIQLVLNNFWIMTMCTSCLHNCGGAPASESLNIPIRNTFFFKDSILLFIYFLFSPKITQRDMPFKQLSLTISIPNIRVYPQFNNHFKRNSINCLQFSCINHCADCTVTVPKHLNVQKSWSLDGGLAAACCMSTEGKIRRSYPTRFIICIINIDTKQDLTGTVGGKNLGHNPSIRFFVNLVRNHNIELCRPSDSCSATHIPPLKCSDICCDYDCLPAGLCKSDHLSLSLLVFSEIVSKIKISTPFELLSSLSLGLIYSSLSSQSSCHLMELPQSIIYLSSTFIQVPLTMQTLMSKHFFLSLMSQVPFCCGLAQVPVGPDDAQWMSHWYTQTNHQSSSAAAF